MKRYWPLMKSSKREISSISHFPGVLQDTYQQHTGISGYSLLGDGHICYDLRAETLLKNAWKGRE